MADKFEWVTLHRRNLSWESVPRARSHDKFAEGAAPAGRVRG